MPGNLTLATDFLSRLLSAWFLAAMMVRVVSVLFAVSYIVNSYEVRSATDSVGREQTHLVFSTPEIKMLKAGSELKPLSMDPVS